MRTIYWLSTEDPEWDAAWSAFPDPSMVNGNEVLQYMGTVTAPQCDYAHEFRHRMLPGTNPAPLLAYSLYARLAAEGVGDGATSEKTGGIGHSHT